MKVFVTLYEHKHGSDVAVYATEAKANAARQEVAREWWDNEMGGGPMPSDPELAADEYFAAVEDREWFGISEHEVIE